MDWIPFNRPHTTGTELHYIQSAIENGHLSGNGPFARLCCDWLERLTACDRALLTHSCTGALEMGALLTSIGPGDEVIMPSFTFVSTANCVALRGATPVFVDVREDTLNIDEQLVADAIGPRTKSIIAVHYAGVSCEMDVLCDLARRHDLFLIEDAAQGILSTYDERPLGTFGAAAALSFHETKNVLAGEGGALLVNDPDWTTRAEILHEKGTDRSQFFRGEVDKYTWMDVGSSYVASEINAAFLWAQLEHAETITRRRLEIWQHYHSALEPLEQAGLLRRPIVPERCQHNAHMYYVRLRNEIQRDEFISHLATRGVHAVFHYVPLHSAPAGRRLGRTVAPLPVTDAAAAQLVRLPLWPDMTAEHLSRVTDAVSEAVGHAAGRVRASSVGRLG
jgi:dTDP-4-amino-4,6-dideoxygalactose transaminase